MGGYVSDFFPHEQVNKHIFSLYFFKPENAKLLLEKWPRTHF